MRLPIRKYGDAILRAKGKRVETVDEHIRSLAENMLETMHAANGVGLAAQQVGEALQLTVLDVSQCRRPEHDDDEAAAGDPRRDAAVLLNRPALGERGHGERGCLVFPTSRRNRSGHSSRERRLSIGRDPIEPPGCFHARCITRWIS